MKNPITSAIVVSLGLMASPAHAVSLLLDFGAGATSGTPAAGSADAMKTPGYAAHAGESTFNYGDQNATLTSLVYGNGNAATGVTVTLSAEATVGNNTISFASLQTLNYSAVTGSAVNVPDSVFSGNSPGRQGIFRSGAGAGNNAAVGASISGLAAGTYTIYVTGRNTNTGANDTPANFYLGLGGANPASFVFAGAGNTTQSTAAVSHLVASLNGTTYTSGVTHAEFTVTITEGQSILLASEGTGPNEARGFLNSIEIVAVPEPSVAVLGAGGMLLAVMRRRRK